MYDKSIRSNLSIALTGLFLFVAVSNAFATPSITLSHPGEFEPQDAVWMAWAPFDYKHDQSMNDLQVKMIKAIESHVPVKLMVQNNKMLMDVKKTMAANKVPTEHVSYHVIPYYEMWLRDTGPDFVIDSKGKKKVVDFNFNGWGVYPHYDEFARKDEVVDRVTAVEQGLESIMTRLVGEGGDREFNGQGTMMVVEAVEMQRNPNLSKEQIEAEFKRLFGVTKVIWLEQGLMDDSLANTEMPGPSGEKAYMYGTGGHIDELCRFVGPNTILLAEETEEAAKSDPIAAENKKRLDRNYEILKSATDQDGNLFKIVRIPTVKTEYITLTAEDLIHEFSGYLFGDTGHEGDINWIPAKSYCNFLITNGVVLASSYWKPGMPVSVKQADEKARLALQSVFPNREIITINPMAVNIGGGGIHCITMQEPAVSTVQ